MTMMNHSFLITAHAYPEQLSEIISLLSAPNHYCFINIDKKTKWAEKFIAENKSDHNIFLEGKERMEVTHGGYSQIGVTLRLLHKAYNQSGGADRLFPSHKWTRLPHTLQQNFRQVL